MPDNPRKMERTKERITACTFNRNPPLFCVKHNRSTIDCADFFFTQLILAVDSENESKKKFEAARDALAFISSYPAITKQMSETTHKMMTEGMKGKRPA